MVVPTLYQRLVIEKHKFDPDIWWVVEWHEDHAVIRNRTNGKCEELKGIKGFSDDSICRNLDKED